MNTLTDPKSDVTDPKSDGFWRPGFIEPQGPGLEGVQGLAHKEFPADTAAQRRRYLEHLEGVARERGGVPELPDGEQRTLQSTLRRGWYFGAEGFHEKLLKRLEKLKGKDGKAHDRRAGYTGTQARDHGEAEAKRLIKRGDSPWPASGKAIGASG